MNSIGMNWIGFLVMGLTLAMLGALIIGGIMWDHQGRRDLTAPPDEDDTIREELARTERRIQLHQLAIHQMRVRQINRERELIRSNLRKLGRINGHNHQTSTIKQP